MAIQVFHHEEQCECVGVSHVTTRPVAVSQVMPLFLVNTVDHSGFDSFQGTSSSDCIVSIVVRGASLCEALAPSILSLCCHSKVWSDLTGLHRIQTLS